MTWSDAPIDGQQSVSANKSPLNNAFTYIANEMKNDHFWDNANSNLDGRHQFVQMPKLEAGGNPANPAIATDMNGVFYMKQKTATEAPNGPEVVEPFYFVNDGTQNQIVQMGFRAMAQFQGRATNGACTLNYFHNITSISRTDEGLYTITYTTALPSNNYIVLGTSMRFNKTNIMYVGIADGANKIASLPAAATTTKISFQYSGNKFRDPDIATIAIIGG